MTIFTPQAAALLKMINLSCPMTNKSSEILKLYDDRKLTIEMLAKKLPITAATLLSARKKGKRITDIWVIEAFGGKTHLEQTSDRLETKIVYLQGKWYDFKKYLATKNIFLDSEINQATFTLFDTLLPVTVKSFQVYDYGNIRATVIYENIEICNAVLPSTVNLNILERQGGFIHFGTIVTEIKPHLTKVANRINRIQLQHPLFCHYIELLNRKVIDTENFCPKSNQKGAQLATYAEEILSSQGFFSPRRKEL